MHLNIQMHLKTGSYNMKCSKAGCENLRALQKIDGKGQIKYFKWCTQHRADRYKKHQESFCENIDGRLGFVCEAKPLLFEMLEVDHIDGNRKNNSECNLQTLCANCHSYKTITLRRLTCKKVC